jgi:GH43 family beta-xylosidase
MSLSIMTLLALGRLASAQTTQPATAPGTFSNPIIRSVDAPDPWIVREHGNYYFTATLGGGGIFIWKSPTLSGMDQADRKKIWTAPAQGPTSRHIWAPELYHVGGRWYVYFTASDGPDRNHRQFVLQSKSDDPQGEFDLVGRIDSIEEFEIDGSVLQLPDGKRYWMYSNGKLQLEPLVSPLRADSEQRVEIAKPTEPWERGWLEAPEALIHEGRVFVVYSAGHSATPHYVLGLLELKSGANPLDPQGWIKHSGPVFAPYVGPDGSVFTIGHNCFTKSPDGKEDWIVYHGKDWRDDKADEGFHGRKTRAQRFTWNTDGTPNFGHPIPSGVPVPLPSGEANPAPAAGAAQ